MTTGDTPDFGAPRRRRGRPRTPDAETRILHAALEEYGELGWSGFTIDRVARRAQVGKSTIYLRWSDKESLMSDAIREADRAMALPEDTGSLRGDLRETTLILLTQFSTPAGWALYRVIFEAASNANSSGYFPDEVKAEYTQRGAELFARAERRGDQVLTVPSATVMAILYGAAIQHVLPLRMDGEELTDERREQCADAIMDALFERAS